MNRQSKNAIKVIQKYVEELKFVTNEFEGNSWKAKTHEALNLYIGPDSPISKRIEILYFTEKKSFSVEGAVGSVSYNAYNGENKKLFVDLLQSAINHIHHHGVKSNQFSNNFLSQFSTIQILGGILTLGSVLFSIGVWVGNLENQREIIKIEGELSSAKNKELILIDSNDKYQNEIGRLKNIVHVKIENAKMDSTTPRTSIR